MQKQSTILYILLTLLSIQCKRNNLDTLIKVKVSSSEYGTPFVNAPFIISTEIREKGSNGLGTRTDTFYTGADGEATVNYTMSEKSGYTYYIQMIQGDSNAPSRVRTMLLPGYPNFYTEKVNTKVNFPMYLQHISSITDDKAVLYAYYSEFPGSRNSRIAIDFPLGKDTSFYLPALNDHIMDVSISYSITKNGVKYYYYEDKKILVDMTSIPPSTEFFY